MGKAVAGEDRKLLAADQGVHPVDGGNARLDEVPRIGPGIGIHRKSVHVAPVRAEDLRIAVRRAAEAVEDAAEQTGADADFHGPFQEFDPRIVGREARAGTEDLDCSPIFRQVDDLAQALAAVASVDRHRLAESDPRAPGSHDHRSFYPREPPVFDSPHNASIGRSER